MQNDSVFAGFEPGKNSSFFWVGCGEDQRMSLITVSGDDNVVVNFRFAILQMDTHAAVVVVGYRFNFGVEKYMIRGKPFHDCINVTLGTMLKRQPLRPGTHRSQKVMVPPTSISRALSKRR